MKSLQDRLEDVGLSTPEVSRLIRLHRLLVDVPARDWGLHLRRRNMVFDRLVQVLSDPEAKREFTNRVSFEANIDQLMVQIVSTLASRSMGPLRLVPNGTTFFHWQSLHAWKQHCYRHLPS